jgi:hypothetical protein
MQMAMKTPAYIGAVVGMIALIIVAVHADFPAMLRTLSSALAVGMVKRIRELALSVPTLLGWQWVEGRRLRRAGAP